jgi:hypothetical protein
MKTPPASLRVLARALLLSLPLTLAALLAAKAMRKK